jgi:hypothetical protein
MINLNLTEEQLNKIKAIDNMSLELIKELSSKDKLVDTLKGVDQVNGPLIELLYKMSYLISENYRLEAEIQRLKVDLGKVIRLHDKVMSDYEYQQLKNTYTMY